MFSKLALSTVALAALGSAASTTTSATSSATGATHSVTVGEGGGIIFKPNSLNAAVGDKIEFSWASGPHSVTQGDFANPCQPASASSFMSGFLSNSKTFTVTVNSTDPIYFYCAVEGHCQGGMVGAINAPAGKDAAAFASAAAKTSTSNAPPQAQGGIVGDGTTSSPSGTTTSAPSSSGTSTTGTSSTSTTASASSTSKPNSASSNFQVGFFSVFLAVTVMLFGNSS